jgi:phosphoribosylglycinamide formyltransferase-1
VYPYWKFVLSIAIEIGAGAALTTFVMNQKCPMEQNSHPCFWKWNSGSAIFDAQIACQILLRSFQIAPDAAVLDRAQKAHIETFTAPMLPDRAEWDRELETLGCRRYDQISSSALALCESFLNGSPLDLKSSIATRRCCHFFLVLMQCATPLLQVLPRPEQRFIGSDAGLDTGQVIAQERVPITP